MAGKTRDGIFKRGRFWHLRKDPVTGRQKSTGKTDKQAALAFKAERERLAANPRHAAAQEARLDEWIERFLAGKQRQGRSAATLSYYAKKLGHWIRFLGEDAVLADVTARAVDNYVQTRRDEGAASPTISKEVDVMVRILKTAERAGYYDGSAHTLKPEDLTLEYRPRERALTMEELNKLLPELSGSLATIVAVSAALGVRLSEAVRLRPEDIDRSTGLVRIRGTKTKASDRTVPIVSIFRELLEAAVPGLPVEAVPNNLYRSLDAACRRAGIPRCTPNDLRRSHATILLEHSVDPDVVRRLLGHTSTAMVNRVYGRTRASVLGELAEQAIQRRVHVAVATHGRPCTAVPSVQDCANPAGNRPLASQVSYPQRPSNPLVGGSNPSGRAERATYAKPLSRKCSQFGRLVLAYAAHAVSVLADRSAVEATVARLEAMGVAA